MEQIVIYLLMTRQLLNSNKKNTEILPYSLCLRNISKDWSVDNMTKKGFNDFVYDFSVDYDDIAVNDILDIHMYLMKKNSMI